MKMWVGGDSVSYERIFKINDKEARHSVINYSGIHDIIRYNVSDWLNQFDDAKRTMVRFNKSGVMSSYEVDQIYEIILSVEMKQNHSVSFQHYRIQVSQHGLQNIQRIRIPSDSKSLLSHPLQTQNQINEIKHGQSIS